MKRRKNMRMELIDTGFSQRLMDRHTDSHLFEIDFPAISHTKRNIARIRSLELIYALTHLVMRQEITNSFAITKKIVNSVKQMWNVTVHLEFPLNRCKDLPSGMKRGLIPKNYQLSRFTGQKPATTPEQSFPGHRHEHTVTSLFNRHFPGPALSLSRKTIHAESHRPIRDEGQQGSPEMISYFRSSMVNPTKTREYQLSRFTGQKPATTPEQSFPGHRHEHTVTSLFNRHFPGPALSLSRKTIHAESHRPIRDEGQQGSPEMISYFRSSMVNLIHPLIHGGSATKTREYQLSRFTGQKPATTPEQSVPGHRRQEAHTPSAQSISGFSTPFSVFSRSTFFPGQKSVTPERQGISLFSPKNDVTRRPHEPRDASEMIPYLRSTGEAAIEDGHMHLYHRSPATTPYMWHSPGSNNEPGSVSAENTNIYHTHPEIEHVTSTHTEIVNERVIERESDSKPLHATPQPLSIDVDRMADQIYQLIERRTRIERERRGL